MFLLKYNTIGHASHISRVWIFKTALITDQTLSLVFKSYSLTTIRRLLQYITKYPCILQFNLISTFRHIYIFIQNLDIPIIFIHILLLNLLIMDVNLFGFKIILNIRNLILRKFKWLFMIMLNISWLLGSNFGVSNVSYQAHLGFQKLLFGRG